MLHEHSIGTDIDGTMIHNTGDTQFLEYLESQGFTNALNIYKETHSWQKTTDLSGPEIGTLFVQFVNNLNYSPPPPLPGAPKAFYLISQCYDIHLITCRDKQTRIVTLTHLKKHFDCPFASSSFNALNQKAQHVIHTNAVVYLEDNPAHAHEVAEVTTVILIPSPSFSSTNLNPKIVQPQAHRLVNNDMSEKDWHQVWTQSWREIPSLIDDCIASQHRTNVALPSTSCILNPTRSSTNPC